ncbi:hypothetical protein X798_03774 [Onchocerca flexuosa]|uniref:Uncharacterized protein n=2 Tax=Onchocerca flexuosa TaxID=387005 RepID=A0A183GYZ5_9BILA|nr:hypothetical protein X798_03774 [Onchocerca flexuosa]VDO25856.1 unnamed protein product [Onchocerca flexuosa]
MGDPNKARWSSISTSCEVMKININFVLPDTSEQTSLYLSTLYQGRQPINTIGSRYQKTGDQYDRNEDAISSICFITSNLYVHRDVSVIRILFLPSEVSYKTIVRKIPCGKK